MNVGLYSGENGPVDLVTRMVEVEPDVIKPRRALIMPGEREERAERAA